jgi:uncharacterized protein YndB with AHSA1/START domain
MTTTGLSKIEKRIFIRAPRAKVWRALTTAREFAQWFGVKVTQEFQPGTRVKMTYTYGGREFEGYLDVQEMTPENRFSWRWHPGVQEPDVDYSKEPTTLVEFQLEEAEGGTLLSVVETGFDEISLQRRARVFEQNEGGWAHQMKAIENYVGQAH